MEWWKFGTQGPFECESSIKWLSLLVTKCPVFDDVIFPTS